MKHTLLFSSFFLTLISWAQPTITQADLTPVIGSSALVDSVNYVDLSEMTGPNQTWDLSDLQPIGETLTYNWVNPADAPGGEDFPNANYAVEVDFLSFFYDISGNEYNEVGYYLEFQGATAIETFSDAAVRYTFPLTYGTTGSDDYTSNTSFSLGFEIESNGQLNWEVEGYGTAILPFGTFTDVLLLHVNDFTEDAQSVGGTTFLTTLENEIYVLYKAGNPLPLAIFEEIITTDFIGNVEVDYGGTTFNSQGGMNTQEETAAELRVYPNPVSNILNVDLTGKSVDELTLWTVDGRMVNNFSVRNPGLMQLEMSALNAGMYILHARGENELYTACISVK